MFSIDFYSALCGFVGSLLIFFFGISPRISSHGHVYLILEQEDEKEKGRAKKYKAFSYSGVFLLILSFLLQIIKVFK